MQTPADVIKIHDVTASSAGARRRRNELLSLSLSFFACAFNTSTQQETQVSEEKSYFRISRLVEKLTSLVKELIQTLLCALLKAWRERYCSHGSSREEEK